MKEIIQIRYSPLHTCLSIDNPDDSAKLVSITNKVQNPGIKKDQASVKAQKPFDNVTRSRLWVKKEIPGIVGGKTEALYGEYIDIEADDD